MQTEGAALAIERALSEWNLPALVVGLTDRYQLQTIIVHGYADLKAHIPLPPDSRFAIGSISKSFTALALLQLAQEGRLDLHAPLTQYLPGLAISSPFAPFSAHHVLTHTAGIPNYLTHAASSRYVLAELRHFTPSYAPGTQYWYSNTGYQLLGYVLEDLEGMPYPKVIRRRILEPLGMESTSAVIDDAERSRMVSSYALWPADGTYVEAPWFEYTAADGSLISTVSDMAAYTRCILNRGQGPTGRLLTAKAFDSWITPVLEAYGYGLFAKTEKGTTVVGHSGAISGFQSELEVHLEEGFGLVMLSSSVIPDDLKKWMTQTMAAAFRGGTLPATPTRRRSANVEDYAGIYHLAPSAPEARPILECVAQQGRLWLNQGNQSTPLERMGEDCFRVTGLDSDGVPFFFGRRDTGSEIVDVAHGAQWYIRDGVLAQVASGPPPDYSGYVGHFVSTGPEGPAARVFVRNRRLYASLSLSEGSKPLPLEPLAPDVFRLSEPDYAPERVQFDTVINGRALRMTLSGVPLYRKETP